MGKEIIHLVRIVALILLAGVAASAGELDPDFGVDGRVAIEIGTHGDRAQAIAIQSDGKILLGGASTDGETLAYSIIRLFADGSPDSSFNGDGTIVLDLGSGDDEILALGLSADGHILAGGYTSRGMDRDFALVRFNPDGSLDTSFGDQGKVFTSVGNSDDEITALAVDDSGAVLVAGSAAGTNGRVIVLARYLEDGRLDTGFSDQGLNLTGIGNDVLAQGMAVGGDGRIVISGSYTDGETTRMMLVGFTSDGLIQSDFGENGVATTLFTREISEGYGIFQQQDGSLFVVGSVGVEGERAAALFRFTAQGAADASFGEDGVLITEIGPEDDVLYSLVGDATSLNASGFTTTNTNRDFLLITYDPGVADTQSVSAQPAARSGKTGGSLHIGELQVTDSFADYASDDVKEDLLLPAVMTTSFGTGESVSYALALQKDGKVVTVGTSGDNGMTSAVVARYKAADSVVPTMKSVYSSVFVSTTVPTDVTATGAFTGGVIRAGLGSVSQRGVVFSIAPYPVCKTNCFEGVVDDGGDGGNNGDGNSGAPVVSGETPTGTIDTTFTTLAVATDVDATCKYGVTANTAYDNILNTFDNTHTTSHSQSLNALLDGTSYTYYVRCKNNTSGLVNTSDTLIEFNVDTSSSSLNASIPAIKKAGGLLVDATGKVGGFLVPSAHAQTIANDTTTSSSTSSASKAFSSGSPVNKEGYTIDGAGIGPYGSILEDLTPDTRYYVRAYAIAGGVAYYGEQVAFETPNACFIATAAYGSSLHPAVGVLRDFRDRYLKTNHFGRQFIAWYYKNSPPIAEKISLSTGLRFVVRLVLVPLIAVSWFLLHPQALTLFFWLACLTAILLQFRQHRFFGGSAAKR